MIDTNQSIRAMVPTFRDLGGVVSKDGRVVRKGLLFRAGHFMEASTQERELVRDLQLRQILDLRSETERSTTRNNWIDNSTQVLNADIAMDIRSGHEGLIQLIEEDCSVTGARKMMLTTYYNFPRSFEQQLKPMFDAMLNEQGLPLLIHCTVGKDRTGFACAMLLNALGVGEEEIIKDYLQIGDALIGNPIVKTMEEILSSAIGRPLSQESLDVIMGVRTEFIESSFSAIQLEYGGVEEYLKKAAGIDKERLEKLRVMYLESLC